MGGITLRGDGAYSTIKLIPLNINILNHIVEYFFLHKKACHLFKKTARLAENALKLGCANDVFTVRLPADSDVGTLE